MKFGWLQECPQSPLHGLLRQLQVVASAQVPLLLLGETGIGKDVFARRLHSQSPRAHAPFVPVNCGSLNPALLESTLFGSVRGAFTGAHQDTLGLIRAAHGGTLFLDEIGELPLDAQSRLLRVLQEKAVVPVGGLTEIPVDFRLVCATHRNLAQAVAQGTFREDLFFRIHVYPLSIPALRERPQDIFPLAKHIWHELEPQAPALVNLVSKSEQQMLGNYSWPGNVRQLKNLLQRFALMRLEEIPLIDVLQVEPQKLAEHAPEYQVLRPRPSPTEIRTTLMRTHFNKCSAARELGISRGSLCYQLRKMGLE